MAWDVIAVEEFAEWLFDQPDRVQVETAAAVAVLAEFGPQLGRPSVDTLRGSAFDNMKELRYKVGKRPYSGSRSNGPRSRKKGTGSRPRQRPSNRKRRRGPGACPLFPGAIRV